jgi:hypothetical protein
VTDPAVALTLPLFGCTLLLLAGVMVAQRRGVQGQRIIRGYGLVAGALGALLGWWLGELLVWWLLRS